LWGELEKALLGVTAANIKAPVAKVAPTNTCLLSGSSGPFLSLELLMSAPPRVMGADYPAVWRGLQYPYGYNFRCEANRDRFRYALRN